MHPIAHVVLSVLREEARLIYFIMDRLHRVNIVYLFLNKRQLFCYYLLNHISLEVVFHI